MGKSLATQARRLVSETARIVCEEGHTDYRLAKLKAAERLGLGSGVHLPSNAEVQQAVIEYQRLFGGREYAQRLSVLRKTAVQAMRMLEQFEPRLVGAVASGATTDANHVQLHCFADKPEAIDWLLESRGLKFDVNQRRYRYPDGKANDVPVITFMAADVGVDVAVFPERGQRSAPLSMSDGQVVRRLDLAAVELLAAEEPDVAG
jgi:hypothetical protein